MAQRICLPYIIFNVTLINCISCIYASYPQYHIPSLKKEISWAKIEGPYQCGQNSQKFTINTPNNNELFNTITIANLNCSLVLSDQTSPIVAEAIDNLKCAVENNILYIEGTNHITSNKKESPALKLSISQAIRNIIVNNGTYTFDQIAQDFFFLTAKNARVYLNNINCKNVAICCQENSRCKANGIIKNQHTVNLSGTARYTASQLSCSSLHGSLRGASYLIALIYDYISLQQFDITRSNLTITNGQAIEMILNNESSATINGGADIVDIETDQKASYVLQKIQPNDITSMILANTENTVQDK